MVYPNRAPTSYIFSLIIVMLVVGAWCVVAGIIKVFRSISESHFFRQLKRSIFYMFLLFFSRFFRQNNGKKAQQKSQQERMGTMLPDSVQYSNLREIPIIHWLHVSILHTEGSGV